MFNFFSQKNPDLQEIIEFIKQDDLFRPRKEKLQEFMRVKFSDYETQTDIVFNELAKLVDDDPQLLIDTTKTFFTDRTTMTKMFDAGRRQKIINNNAPADKIRFIADTYECLSILKLPVYLLSGKRAPYTTLSSPDAILAQLKRSGLLPTNGSKVRLLRNSIDHTFSVEDDNIIADDKSKIPLSVIDDLYKSLENITSWWMTFATYNFFCMPKYSILVSLGIYDSIEKDSTNWNSYVNGLKLFYADIMEQQEKEKEEKERSINYKFRKIKKRVRRIVKRNILERFTKHSRNYLFDKHIPLVLERVAYHAEYFFSEIESIVKKLTVEIDKNRLLIFSDFIKSNYLDIKAVSDLINQNLDLYDKALTIGKTSSTDSKEIFYSMLEERLSRISQETK